MFTVSAIASHLQVSDEAILAHIRAGRLKAANVGGGSVRPRWRISQSALDQFLAARSTQPKPAPKRKQKRAAEEVTYFS